MMRSSRLYPGLPGRCLRGGILALILALLAACASTPPPTDAMQRAQMEIKDARQAGAADSDPVDLNFAVNKFQQAQAQMSKKNYGKAANLADEAQADARLAFTKARLAALRQKIRSQTRENKHLRTQLLNKAQSISGGQSGQAPAASGSTVNLPDQVLPQPAAPAPASSSAGSDAAQGGGA